MTNRWIDPATGRLWGSAPDGWVHPKLRLHPDPPVSHTERVS